MNNVCIDIPKPTTHDHLNNLAGLLLSLSATVHELSGSLIGYPPAQTTSGNSQNEPESVAEKLEFLIALAERADKEAIETMTRVGHR